jgi:DNA-binding transcriptional ArsR family regulator
MERDRVLTDTAALLRLIASPIRLGLLLELENGPMSVTELVELSGASQSLVSQHLRLLRAGRIVTATRKGREVRYAIADGHVAHIARDATLHIQEGES